MNAPSPNTAPPEPTAPAVRAALARAALGLTPRAADARVGPLTLHPHQRHAVARLRYALRHYGVALLADDVGLGKTAVALALLREATHATVVAPAALRPHWADALRTAGLACRFVTTESLGASRNHPGHDTATADLVVVDEAHHFRNPHTRRWQRLAAVAAPARLLLLSATPIHNRPADLAALLALALGTHAARLDAPALARLVVRRAAGDLPAAPEADQRGQVPNTSGGVVPLGLIPPAVASTAWTTLPAAPHVLAAVAALPAAVPAADGGSAPGLERLTLLRLWTSSEAALRAGVRRRLARASALADALAAGGHATRRDLDRLCGGLTADPGAVQLSLLVPGSGASVSGAPALQTALGAYVAGLRRVAAALDDASGTVDAARIAWLRAIRARHPGAHVVAFTHSAETARAIYRGLAPDGRVALLTANGGRIASGAVTRVEVLAAFAPNGQGRAPPPPVACIECLVTTDVLSEGLDLRDATIVAHLDLPWTPARLAQRVGRAARPGSAAPEVHVYALRPPADVARLLRLAARHRAKSRAAGRTVGRGGQRGGAGPAALARDRLLERWSTAGGDDASDASPARAVALRCAARGYVAVVALPAALGALAIPTLVASLDGRPPSSARHTVARALALVACADAVHSAAPDTVADARQALRRWARRRRARADVAGTGTSDLFGTHPGSRVAAALLARAARALHAAPPDARPTLAADVAALRAALALPIPAAVEQTLHAAGTGTAELTGEPLHHGPSDADRAWLHAAAPIARARLARAEDGTGRARPTLRALAFLIP